MHPNPADSRIEILASKTRTALGIPNDETPDPIDVLRRLTYIGAIEGWQFVSDEQLTRAEATWNGRSILLRQEVANRIEAGDPEARFTVFHEIAHVLLKHPERNRGPVENRVQFGRYVEQDEIEADTLAAALMAPEELANVDQATDVVEFARRFGLPPDKAQTRLEDLKRRQRHRLGVPRKLPATREIDTSDYAECMLAMRANATRWNS